MAPKAVVVWTPSPRDAELYGLDGPQTCDPNAMLDMPASRLEALERVTMQHAGLMLADVWLNDGTDKRITTTRAIMWLTLQFHGRDIAWADFDPLIGRTTFTPSLVAVEGDPDPLESAAETSSPAEE